MYDPPSRPFPLHTGVATATRVRALTPQMTRITFAAPEFADFGVEQPGEILTLGWPDRGHDLVLPLSRRGWRFPNGRGEQHWRNFTVRSIDRANASVDVDFFLHGDLGRASAWARRADAGDTVGFAGPRIHWAPDPSASWSLLAADETGLPALLAILEALPVGHPTVAVVEVQDEAERQQVRSGADLELHWASREGRPAGTTTVLIDALRELPLPDGHGQVWGGGEALAMRDVRDHLRLRHPEAARSMRALGYWKHRATPDDVD